MLWIGFIVSFKFLNLILWWSFVFIFGCVGGCEWGCGFIVVGVFFYDVRFLKWWEIYGKCFFMCWWVDCGVDV